jgi:hypothetical protein
MELFAISGKTACRVKVKIQPQTSAFPFHVLANSYDVFVCPGYQLENQAR